MDFRRKRKRCPLEEVENSIKPKGACWVGFQGPLIFNDALLAKMDWGAYKEPNVLWLKVLKGLYFLYW